MKKVILLIIFLIINKYIYCGCCSGNKKPQQTNSDYGNEISYIKNKLKTDETNNAPSRDKIVEVIDESIKQQFNIQTPINDNEIENLFIEFTFDLGNNPKYNNLSEIFDSYEDEEIYDLINKSKKISIFFDDENYVKKISQYNSNEHKELDKDEIYKDKIVDYFNKKHYIMNGHELLNWKKIVLYKMYGDNLEYLNKNIPDISAFRENIEERKKYENSISEAITNYVINSIRKILTNKNKSGKFEKIDNLMGLDIKPVFIKVVIPYLVLKGVENAKETFRTVFLYENKTL